MHEHKGRPKRVETEIGVKPEVKKIDVCSKPNVNKIRRIKKKKVSKQCGIFNEQSKRNAPYEQDQSIEPPRKLSNMNIEEEKKTPSPIKRIITDPIVEASSIDRKSVV